MDLFVVSTIAVLIGVVVGFVAGKRVSGWCVDCGRSRAQVLRRSSAGAR